ncbi:MAG: CoA pyrophosphatase [Roseinatronobacter sp.]
MPGPLEARLRAALRQPARPSSDYDLNTGITLPAERVLRPAAVLVGVQDHPTGARVVLTKRASHLRNHPGQIAFPGGRQDAGDVDMAATALREAQEEIALPAGAVQVLGTLPAHETVTGFQVTPVLALIAPDVEFVPEASEVAEIFTVPLSHLCNPACFQVEKRRWRGVWRYYYVVPWGPYYIWGATARILRGLADRITP